MWECVISILGEKQLLSVCCKFISYGYFPSLVFLLEYLRGKEVLEFLIVGMSSLQSLMREMMLANTQHELCQ